MVLDNNDLNINQNNNNNNINNNSNSNNDLKRMISICDFLLNNDFQELKFSNDQQNNDELIKSNSNSNSNSSSNVNQITNCPIQETRQSILGDTITYKILTIFSTRDKLSTYLQAARSIQNMKFDKDALQLLSTFYLCVRRSYSYPV